MKNNLLLIYTAKDKKEIKRVTNPVFIPRLNEEINFDNTESNLVETQIYRTYTVMRVVYVLPDLVMVSLNT